MSDRTLTPAEGASRAEMSSEVDIALDDDERRAWAALMHQPVEARALPMPRDAGAAASGRTPGAWRTSDVSLTDLVRDLAATPRARGVPGGTVESSGVVARLATSVNVASLGNVSFSVDRSDVGVRVVMEVESERAAAAVDAERQTLLRTLRAAGLTVLAFRVLVRPPAGITLAQRAAKPNAAIDSAPSQADGVDESDDEERRKRVRFVG